MLAYSTIHTPSGRVRPVELITAAAHHASAGDAAIAEVTVAQLALRGVPVIPREQGTGTRTAIIGGGHVLGNSAHGGDQYHSRGPHLLNAAGILNPHCDFRYLREYRYVAVRDRYSAEVLADQGVVADVVPCPATLIEPLEPSIWQVGNLGEQTVAACRDTTLVDANPRLAAYLTKTDRVVAIHPQAWLTWRAELPYPAVPPMLPPRFLATVIQTARCLITQSLHAAIFAVAVGTPVCVVAPGSDPQSTKLRRYFERAGFPELISDGVTPVEEQALATRTLLLAMQDAERQRTHDHLDRMAAICFEDVEK